MHFDAFPLESDGLESDRRQVRCEKETLLRLIEEEFGRLCGLAPKNKQPLEHLSLVPEDAETVS